MLAMLVAIGKRVVVDQFRPASQHHFWETEWITRLGLTLAPAHERR
jgi:hypothetical protein